MTDTDLCQLAIDTYDETYRPVLPYKPPAHLEALRAVVDVVREHVRTDTETRITTWLRLDCHDYSAGDEDFGHAVAARCLLADAIGRGEHRQDSNTLHECGEEGNAFGSYNCTCGQPWLDTLGGCQADPLPRSKRRDD